MMWIISNQANYLKNQETNNTIKMKRIKTRKIIILKSSLRSMYKTQRLHDRDFYDFNTNYDGNKKTYSFEIMPCSHSNSRKEFLSELNQSIIFDHCLTYIGNGHNIFQLLPSISFIIAHENVNLTQILQQ